MRSVTAIVLSLLLGLAPVPLRAQGDDGRVEGVVSIEGRPLAGISLALVNLQTGAVHNVKTGAAGAYQVQVAPGEYTISSAGQAGLAVGRGPIRLFVGAGQVAVADVEMVALPVGQEPPPQAPTSIDAPQAADLASPQDASSPGADIGQEAGIAPAPGQWTIDVPAPEGGAAIRHDKVGCLVAGEYPLFDALINPSEIVARGRVFFKPGGSDEWYFVEMSLLPEGKFQAKLPRPRLEASPITYYVQATTTTFVESQTPEIQAIVVEHKEDCRDLPAAAFGSPGPVQVFSATSGAAISVPGFAAGGLAAAGLIAAIVGGAAAVGLGTVIVNNPTPTPSPTPTPIPPTSPPTPTPIPPPVPTPTPTPVPPPPCTTTPCPSPVP
jgi:hypothetical protein